FQAEDGIRYRNVTGVQTCALPISFNAPEQTLQQALTSATDYQAPTDAPAETVASDRPLNIVAVTACPTGVAHTFMAAEAISTYRSEERRVGKEFRFTWEQYT